MLTHTTAIILGIIEGATEFVPVSSSGHLIVARAIMGENAVGAVGVVADGLAVDAVLQLAASCALLVYFWRDIIAILRTVVRLTFRKTVEQSEKMLVWAIALGTVPAIVVGLLLEGWMETIFRNPRLVAVTLILGSVLFWIAERIATRDKILSLGRGVLIGIFQCLALVPGVSRSGATISGGLIAGLTQQDAVRFSFLLSIPIIFGAGLKKLFDVVGSDFFSNHSMSPLVLGSVVAFLVGLASVHLLIKYLRTHSLTIFAWYRIALAIIILLTV